MPHGGIRSHDLSRRAAVDLSLRPPGHWDRQVGTSKTTVTLYRTKLNNIKIIELVEVGQTCSTYGRYEKCIGCMVLVQKTEEKKSLAKNKT